MSNSTSSASNQKNRYEEAIALVKAKELQHSSTFKKVKNHFPKMKKKILINLKNHTMNR